MDITEEYIIEALENTAKYAFYKEYVEPLEIEHDELLDALDESRHEINGLRKQIQKLKESKKQPFKEDTAVLRREYEKLLKEVSVLTQENTELRKENKKQKKKMILYPIILILTYIILLPFVLLLSKVNIAFTTIGLLIYFYLPFITTNKLVRMIVDKEPLIKRNKSSNKISRNNKIGSFTNGEALALYNREKHNNVPKTEKNEKLLDRGYGIYREVQRAWMNFDYDALRTLVTDELYNSYYNQLQTLELKGQKNVMNNFFLIDEELLRIDEENGLWTILMRLEVEFNDYIVDSDNKIVRGSNKDKVIMNYLLTFVENEKSEDKCPHCGAKLEEGITVCNYCKAVIQSTSSQMKLAKKEAISQRPGRSYNK